MWQGLNRSHKTKSNHYLKLTNKISRTHIVCTINSREKNFFLVFKRHHTIQVILLVTGSVTRTITSKMRRGILYLFAFFSNEALVPLGAVVVVQFQWRNTSREVCFDLIGCFSMDRPWRTPFRPIPDPFGPDKMNVELFYFSKPNAMAMYTVRAYPTVDLSGAPFDPKKPTVIIIHGFIDDGRAKWAHEMKDAYLGTKDANIMITDWSRGAMRVSYHQAVSNTRVVARLIARVLEYLMNTHGLRLTDVHLIGHSLGAHISAYIGKSLPGIGRLTGLDPALPAFEGFGKAVQLGKTDAEFVDVIHTDGSPVSPFGVGVKQPHGHVDFYVNGGSVQPGCFLKDTLPRVRSIIDLAILPVAYTARIKECNHRRSYIYLTEAFRDTSCTFWGIRASSTELASSIVRTLTGVSRVPPKCTIAKCVPLGFDTKTSLLRGIFLVPTAWNSPFCLPQQ